MNSWLLDAIRYFRDLDFFTALRNLTDDDLANYLNERATERVGDTVYLPSWERRRPGRRPWFLDICLLAYDEDRIWWRDLEDNIFPGQNACIELINEWARISRGAFRPTHITETWADSALRGDSRGGVTVSFEHDGVEHRLTYPFREWIPIAWLDEINGLIAATGYRFEEPPTGDQSGVAVVLTPEEKDKLRRERRWRFEWNPKLDGF